MTQVIPNSPIMCNPSTTSSPSPLRIPIHQRSIKGKKTPVRVQVQQYTDFDAKIGNMKIFSVPGTEYDTSIRYCTDKYQIHRIAWNHNISTTPKFQSVGLFFTKDCYGRLPKRPGMDLWPSVNTGCDHNAPNDAGKNKIYLLNWHVFNSSIMKKRNQSCHIAAVTWKQPLSIISSLHSTWKKTHQWTQLN